MRYFTLGLVLALILIFTLPASTGIETSRAKIGSPTAMPQGPGLKFNGLSLAMGPELEPNGVSLAMGSIFELNGLLLAMGPELEPGGFRAA